MFVSPSYTDPIRTCRSGDSRWGELQPRQIIGDGQWGNVHVHDLVNQALKWEVHNPEHGVTNIAIGDVDYDGVVALLWGAGATSSGPDRLYVANTTRAHDIKWQNLDLEGPFLGPANGDLDGDGQSELVISSTSSDAGYSSGRILVFDLSTLVLRAISPPVANGFSAYGVHDLKLRDVEGNGRMQIVIATESGYDGLIEIYRFARSGQNCVFSSAQHAVVGLAVAPQPAPTATPNPRATPGPRPSPAPC